MTDVNDPAPNPHATAEEVQAAYADAAMSELVLSRSGAVAWALTMGTPKRSQIERFDERPQRFPMKLEGVDRLVSRLVGTPEAEQIRRDDATIDTQYLESGQYAIDVAGELLPAQLHLRAPVDPADPLV